MTKSRNSAALDQNATCLAILLGMILGALYALTHINKSGAVRRKDVAQIGGGSLELEIEASLRDAKAKARQRLNDDS
ncbi:MAG: hypothetical protein OXN94_14410 [Chloroflexota bacterium]|nr:hypothetical protein [Chloroflexota bacterium]MDE2859033.1 hypothetical protein [Chloroflexota bacterium]MDE2952268.1 hypothetical protein [Chloroflexota bacterium]